MSGPSTVARVRSANYSPRRSRRNHRCVGSAATRLAAARHLLPESDSGKWTIPPDRCHQNVGYEVVFRCRFLGSTVTQLASIAVLPTLAVLDNLPGVAVFENDEISDGLKADSSSFGRGAWPRWRNPARGADQIGGRYLVMIKNPATDNPSISRWNDLDGLDGFMAEHKAAHCTIMDCRLLAELIADRAGPPLIRFEVSEKAEEEGAV